MSSDNPQPVAGTSRRELLKREGKFAAAAAVSSVFSPFVFTGKAAATKTLLLWQFYAPARQVGTQSKWFEDCVKGWNTTHDVKVELQFVPVQEYIGGSKLQTAFAARKKPPRWCLGGKRTRKNLLRRTIMFSSQPSEPMVDESRLSDPSPSDDRNDIYPTICPCVIQGSDILLSTKNIASGNGNLHGNLLRCES
jgi:hypothetical protein